MAPTPAPDDIGSYVASPDLLPVLLPPAVLAGMVSALVAAVVVTPVLRRFEAGFAPEGSGAGGRFRSPVVVGAVAFPASLLVVALRPEVGAAVGPRLAGVLVALAAGVSAPVQRITFLGADERARHRSLYAYAAFVPTWAALAVGCYALLP